MGLVDPVARRKYDNERYRKVIRPALLADPSKLQAYRKAISTSRKKHYDLKVKLPREAAQRQAHKDRLQCNRQSRCIAIQMRTHAVMPDGDIEAFRARVAREVASLQDCVPKPPRI